MIKELLKSELPVEKLINFGPNVLSDAELLSIILKNGTKNKNVLDLSREILTEYNLGITSRKTYSELLKFNGMNKIKSTQIVAIFELARRISNFKIIRSVKFENSNMVYDYIKSELEFLSYEKIICLYIDSKNQLIKHETISKGSIDYSIIDPREIIKNVLLNNASGFFLIHNHPSGNPEPSNEDLEITKQIQKICENLNIRFLDHIIIGDSFYSIFDNDLM